MNEDRYLIKATYLEGPHAGKVYFLRKGGFVTDLYQYQWEDTTYSSRSTAQRFCTRRTKDNDWEVSERGHELGIYSTEKETYSQIMYNERAQLYIVSNFDSIMKETLGEDSII